MGKEGIEKKLNDYAIRHRNAESGLAVFATPLADEDLTKKCLKLVKKAAKHKNIRRGIKEVSKALRKNEKGLMFLAGNITPVDVLSHLPILCEEKDVPYIFVPAKSELGAAGLTKRPTSCILVLEKDNKSYQEKYDKIKEKIQN